MGAMALAETQRTRTAQPLRVVPNYEFHEYANIFPLMTEAELEGLSADIKANGFSKEHPIVLFEGKVLDGRNRLVACNQAGIAPTFKEYRGDDALAYVETENLNRRNLNESQKGLCAARCLTLRARRKVSTPPEAEVSQADAASRFGTSVSTVTRGRLVLDSGTPEEIKAVEDGKLKLGTAERQIKERKKASDPDYEKKCNRRKRSVRAERTAENVLANGLNTIEAVLIAFENTDLSHLPHDSEVIERLSQTVKRLGKIHQLAKRG